MALITSARQPRRPLRRQAIDDQPMMSRGPRPRPVERTDLVQQQDRFFRPDGRVRRARFVKRTDGSMRDMLYRLPTPEYVGTTGRQRGWTPEQYGLKEVWDEQKQDYRMIPVSNMVEVRSGGKAYRRSRGQVPRQRQRTARDWRRRPYYVPGEGPLDEQDPRMRPYPFSEQSAMQAFSQSPRFIPPSQQNFARRGRETLSTQRRQAFGRDMEEDSMPSFRMASGQRMGPVWPNELEERPGSSGRQGFSLHQQFARGVPRRMPTDPDLLDEYRASVAGGLGHDAAWMNARRRMRALRRRPDAMAELARRVKERTMDPSDALDETLDGPLWGGTGEGIKPSADEIRRRIVSGDIVTSTGERRPTTLMPRQTLSNVLKTRRGLTSRPEVQGRLSRALGEANAPTEYPDVSEVIRQARPHARPSAQPSPKPSPAEDVMRRPQATPGQAEQAARDISSSVDPTRAIEPTREERLKRWRDAGGGQQFRRNDDDLGIETIGLPRGGVPRRDIELIPPRTPDDVEVEEGQRGGALTAAALGAMGRSRRGLIDEARIQGVAGRAGARHRAQRAEQQQQDETAAEVQRGRMRHGSMAPLPAQRAPLGRRMQAASNLLQRRGADGKRLFPGKTRTTRAPSVEETAPARVQPPTRQMGVLAGVDRLLGGGEGGGRVLRARRRVPQRDSRHQRAAERSGLRNVQQRIQRGETVPLFGREAMGSQRALTGGDRLRRRQMIDELLQRERAATRQGMTPVTGDVRVAFARSQQFDPAPQDLGSEMSPTGAARPRQQQRQQSPISRRQAQQGAKAVGSLARRRQVSGALATQGGADNLPARSFRPRAALSQRRPGLPASGGGAASRALSRPATGDPRIEVMGARANRQIPEALPGGGPHPRLTDGSPQRTGSSGASGAMPTQGRPPLTRTSLPGARRRQPPGGAGSLDLLPGSEPAGSLMPAARRRGAGGPTWDQLRSSPRLQRELLGARRANALVPAPPQVTRRQAAGRAMLGRRSGMKRILGLQGIGRGAGGTRHGLVRGRGGRMRGVGRNAPLRGRRDRMVRRFQRDDSQDFAMRDKLRGAAQAVSPVETYRVLRGRGCGQAQQMGAMFRQQHFAERAEVGEIRKRKDGNYRKTGDGEWEKVSDGDGGRARKRIGSASGKSSPPEKKQPPGAQLPAETRARLKELGVTKLPPQEATNIKTRDLNAKDVHDRSVMTWTDAAGRLQSAYTQQFHERNAAAKWERIGATFDQRGEIRESTKQAALTETGRSQDAALIATIIAHTGLRPGGGKQTTEDERYGVSTLKPEHVSVNGDTIRFEFLGKSGKVNVVEWSDSEIAPIMKEKLASTDAGSSLFEATQHDARPFLPDGVKLKDMRTIRGTEAALEAIGKHEGPPPPLSPGKKGERELEKALKGFSAHVAEVLNNTPSVARKSYVHPRIWDEWTSNVRAASAKT